MKKHYLVAIATLFTFSCTKETGAYLKESIYKQTPTDIKDNINIHLYRDRRDAPFQIETGKRGGYEGMHWRSEKGNSIIDLAPPMEGRDSVTYWLYKDLDDTAKGMIEVFIIRNAGFEEEPFVKGDGFFEIKSATGVYKSIKRATGIVTYSQLPPDEDEGTYGNYTMDLQGYFR